MGRRDLEGPSAPTRPVEVRTRFERFPATVKGAFVLRGTDGNPHTVRLEGAEVSRIPGGRGKAVPVGDVQVDIPPARDFFVPFEATLSDVDPGWYVIRSTIRVDGGRTWQDDSRPFAVPWPSGAVRKGAVPVRKKISVGGLVSVVERVELQEELATVTWRTETEGVDVAPDARAVLLADGSALEPLPADVAPQPPRGAAAGERRTVSYPVPRSCRSLAVVVRLSPRVESEPVPLQLPRTRQPGS